MELIFFWGLYQNILIFQFEKSILSFGEGIARAPSRSNITSKPDATKVADLHVRPGEL